MDTLGEEFFPGTRLAIDQHIGISLAVLLSQMNRFQKSRALTQNIIKVRFGYMPFLILFTPYFITQILHLQDRLKCRNGTDCLFPRLHRDAGQRDILVIETGNAVEHRLGCFYHLAQGNTGQKRSQPFTRTLRGKTCNISGFPVDEQYLIILIHSYDTIAGIVQDSAEQFGPAPFLK